MKSSLLLPPPPTPASDEVDLLAKEQRNLYLLSRGQWQGYSLPKDRIETLKSALATRLKTPNPAVKEQPFCHRRWEVGIPNVFRFRLEMLSKLRAYLGSPIQSIYLSPSQAAFVNVPLSILGHASGREEQGKDGFSKSAASQNSQNLFRARSEMACLTKSAPQICSSKATPKQAMLKTWPMQAAAKVGMSAQSNMPFLNAHGITARGISPPPAPILSESRERKTKKECVFCKLKDPDEKVFDGKKIDVLVNIFGYARKNDAISKHLLLVPKRHEEDGLGLSADEILEERQTILKLRRSYRKIDPSGEFLIWRQNGIKAGHTVPHTHLQMLRLTGHDEEIADYFELMLNDIFEISVKSNSNNNDLREKLINASFG